VTAAANDNQSSGATRPVLRFAPSPNGQLHLGHALSALTGFDMARRLGGRFLVRIEDIDTARCTEAHIAGQLEDLAWLGITWEEPVLRQSQHFDVYGQAAARLEALGLLYPCFATRQDIAAGKRPNAVDPDGAPIYPGLHKDMPAAEVAERKQRGEPFALRLDMQRALQAAHDRLAGKPLAFTELASDGVPTEIRARPERWGDTIIIRKDTPSSYHLAVVVDDARQGITHVTRGMDLYAATDLHRLLQVLLDLPAPMYHHHRLITDVEGRKLAKSARDTSLASLRQGGTTPAEIRRLIGLAAGN
jgi:glutamyl-Q tRNA(Asp) synthetase